MDSSLSGLEEDCVSKKGAGLGGLAQLHASAAIWQDKSEARTCF